MFNLNKKHLNQILSVFTLLAVVAGLFAFTSPTYASTGSPAAPAPVDKTLMKRYQSEQQWLNTQQTNLDKTATTVAKIQDLIDKAKAAGKDTTEIEATLAIYQSQVATAQNAHTTAASVLAAHNGYDDSGKVTDRDAARLTVDESHQALTTCHDVLVQAGRDLARGLAEWNQILKIKVIEIVLQKDLQAEQNWLAKQQENLDKSGSVVSRVQQLIDNAKSEGKDTTALEAALVTFQSQIATAQSSHNTASGILSNHYGFDANGKVVDRDAARLTVSDARQSLSDAHRSLWQAAIDLHRAIKEWRQNNK